MHIASDRLRSKLSEIELRHLNQCAECNSDYQLLTQLTDSAENSDLINPPDLVWQKIQYSMANKHQPQKTVWRQLSVLAASIVFAGFGWLVVNNYQLQSQLELVLQVNQNLELQLFENKLPSYRQTQLLNEVRLLESRLMNASSTKEKLTLLKRRQKLIADMVKSQQGNQYEFSI